MLQQINATVAAAQQAEANLANLIHQAADQIDDVGNGPLDQAVSRLTTSLEALHQRLSNATTHVKTLLADYAADFAGNPPVPPVVPSNPSPVAQVEAVVPVQMPTVPTMQPCIVCETPCVPDGNGVAGCKVCRPFNRLFSSDGQESPTVAVANSPMIASPPPARPVGKKKRKHR